MKVDASKLVTIHSRLSKERESMAGKLERAKTIATIFSTIAVPVVLAGAGYFIQRSIADDGLKKDYVAIAAGILKEKPEAQEPELRAWAVKVLDENSPVPFSKKAKAGLYSGAPVVAGLAFVPPGEACRVHPPKRKVIDRYEALAKEIKGLDHNAADEKILDFIDWVMKQEKDVLISNANFNCVLEWVDLAEKADINYRQSIGAQSSKSILEELRLADKNKTKPAAAAKAANSAHSK